MVPSLLIHGVVAKPASRAEALCHNWEALKGATQEHEDLAYEFDGHQVHVWTHPPKRGDRCTCGARAWA
jgi:hypothetical protein